VAHIDFNGIHNAVDRASVGAIAHLAFARVVKVDGEESVWITDCRGGAGVQLLQDDDRIRVVRIRTGSGRRYIVLAAEAPTQPIACNAMPVSRIVDIFNAHPCALAIVWNGGCGELSQWGIGSPGRLSDGRNPIVRR